MRSGRVKKDGKEKKQPSGGIKEAALRLLSFRAHAKGELRRKLVKRGFPAVEIAAVTEELEKSGCLDDMVFSKTLASSRSRNKNWGRVKIAAELRNKGVAADIVKEAIDELGPEEERASAKNALKKWLSSRRGARPFGKDGLVKAIRHLCARGFSPSIALRAAEETNEAAGKERFGEFDDEG